MAENTHEDVTRIMTDALGERFTQETTLHLNVAQSTIIITEDKVFLCLMKNWSKQASSQNWIAPAGIMISLLATIATTEFQDYLLSASSWETVFWLAGTADFFWLCFTLVKRKQAPSIEDIVSEMKQVSTESMGSPNRNLD